MIDKKQKIIFKKTSELIPYCNNAKQHPEWHVQQIAASIKEFGFRDPIELDEDGMILAGHGRLAAAQLLKINEVPCIVDSNPLEDHQKKGYIIANNKISMNTGFDLDLLKIDLDELKKLDFDLDILGFSDEELEGLIEPVFEDQFDTEKEDEVPEVPEEPIIKLGDLIELGKHRLICGDSTDKDTFEKLLHGKVDITFTSPPYNVGATPTENKSNKKSKYSNDTDNKPDAEYLKLMVDFTNNCLQYSNYVFVNIQSLSNNKQTFIDYLYNLRKYYAETIIWDKLNSQPAMAENVLNSEFEYIHVFSEKANRAIGTKKFRGTLKNILHISKQTKNEIKTHAATFPVELAYEILNDFSSQDVLDPFCGTGTTLIAAEKLNRICYGIELDPCYCDVIIQRWCEYTGKDDIKINGKKAKWSKLIEKRGF